MGPNGKLLGWGWRRWGAGDLLSCSLESSGSQILLCLPHLQSVITWLCSTPSRNSSLTVGGEGRGGWKSGWVPGEAQATPPHCCVHFAVPPASSRPGVPDDSTRMPPQFEKNHEVPTAWQDEALARDGAVAPDPAESRGAPPPPQDPSPLSACVCVHAHVYTGKREPQRGDE